MKIFVPAFIALAVVTNGCSNAVMSPAYQANPSPRHNYVVTAEIDDGPGSFEVVTATARYSIGPDLSCMPDAEPISGTFPTPTQAFLYPKIRRLSATRYAAQVNVDGMAAKDYFGKGMCSWVFEGLSFSLQATAAPSDTRFVATLGSDELREQRPVTLYFKRTLYPNQAPDGKPEHGTSSRDRLKGFSASQLFTVTITAKESGHDHQQ